MYTPTIQLRRLKGTGCAPIPEDLQAAVKQRLSCSPKGFWHAWREDILRMSQDWRISTKELVLQAHVKTAAGRQQFRVLVDTGAKIPLVFRHGLFPRRVLRKACFPVNFTTADGQPMAGGTHGLFLEFLLPIWRHGRLINARTCSLFAYEANIQGVDVIMGYPFLKVFNLSVDAQHDRLVVCPDEIQVAPIPSQEMEASVTMPTSQVTVTYEVSSDVEVRTMFGCTCNGDFDPKCPLAPYHGMEFGMTNVEPPVVTQEFELELDNNMVDFNDDWQYVAINRKEAVSPLSIEAKQAMRQDGVM